MPTLRSSPLWLHTLLLSAAILAAGLLARPQRYEVVPMSPTRAILIDTREGTTAVCRVDEVDHRRTEGLLCP